MKRIVLQLRSLAFPPRLVHPIRRHAVRDRTSMLETYSEFRLHSFSRSGSTIARSWTAAESFQRCSRRHARTAVCVADSIFSPLSARTTTMTAMTTKTWRSVADALSYEGNVLGMVMAGKKRKTVLVPILHHIFHVSVSYKRKTCLSLP
jgi:hypothetical protein